MGYDDSSFVDKEIQCMNASKSQFGDCEGTFIWTRGEQRFLQRLVDEGKTNHDGSQVTFTQPRRCKPCRLQKRKDREARGQQ